MMFISAKPHTRTAGRRIKTEKMKSILLTLLTILSVSCNSQKKKDETVKIENPIEQQSISQIGEYVVETFQDSQGNLWFGTLEKGVAKYDGIKLTYLTTKDGLPSNRIVKIIEDNSGNLWFGTGAGLSKFDGKVFVNYSEKDGLCSNLISNLFIDSKGVFGLEPGAEFASLMALNLKISTFPIRK
ncbi:MAG: hypothetical protein IPJ82_02830 [Lewinellaceae bacterium]|nr:hypothetical protein [Lewinellaceae bacterium]